MRPRQQEIYDTWLPKVAIDFEKLQKPGELLFTKPANDLWLEIGFGGGEHLLYQALHKPDIGFIGCEPFVNGVGKLLTGICEHRLDNIRIHVGDALEIIAKLPDNAVGRIYLLYPDPWPKPRQHKRRFVTDESLESITRILRRGGQLLFASDIDSYCAWTLSRVTRTGHFVWSAESSEDWLHPWPQWPGTRYEEKARREGRTSAYLTFTKE